MQWSKLAVTVEKAHRRDNAAGRLVEALQAHRAGWQLPLVCAWLRAGLLLLLLLLWRCAVNRRPAAGDLNVFHVYQAARDLRLQC